MSGAPRAGFTIIETMLFLAITGLLMAGVMAGAGIAVNVNRYKDATTSLMTYLQGQYDQAINVQNDRNNQLGCSGSVITGNGNQPRGTSSCTIIGRYIEVMDNGATLQSQPVYAGTDGSSASDDLTALRNSSLFLSSNSNVIDTYSLEWGTKLAMPKSDVPPTSLKLLIVRSPSSGTIRTFSGDNIRTITDLLSDTYRQDTLFCVNQSGLATMPRQGALIVKDAANGSGVKPSMDGSC